MFGEVAGLHVEPCGFDQVAEPPRRFGTYDEVAEVGPGPIRGFGFFWGFYVNGFIPSKHCQPCFRGRRTALHTVSAASGREYRMDEMRRFPYLYVCGVAAGPKEERGRKNLHLPME